MDQAKSLYVVCLAIVVYASGPPAATLTAEPGASGTPARYHLAYEVSAYELAPQWQAGDREWTVRELRDELQRRAAWEKSRQELHVYYYRIGYTLAFPLPLASRPAPDAFPFGIREITYPWLTWLSWELEERWRTLLAAWQHLGDEEAAALLRRELSALNWENYRGDGNQVGLPTGHFAAVLAVALHQPDKWAPAERQHLQAQAVKLLENDIAPWFEKTWADDKPITSPRLHNYVLILFRAAQLAREIDHPLRDPLETRAKDVFRAWCAARKPPVYHSEGTIYDGYLLDSVTEWLEALPDSQRAELLPLGREPLAEFCTQAVMLALPGRVDLQAPLGDVEPEMTYWATVLARVARWYNLTEPAWLLRRFPPSRLRAPALVELIHAEAFFRRDFPAPRGRIAEQMASVTLRTGFEPDDILVTIGLPRCQMGHLHPDAGHVIIGWYGRFWITDPGYQQYRPGEERTYTLGPQSHNLPVIGGIAPTRLAGQLIELTSDEKTMRAVVDMTPAYAGPAPGQRVIRKVTLWPSEVGGRITVRDTFLGFEPGTQVSYHWLGGAYFAWAFRDGWARLSDGERSLWIQFSGGPISARWLQRLPGSRGPLTLIVPTILESSPAELEWWFHLVPQAEWTPPPKASEE